MAKMFLSLGFWMTIVLFIALGYAFRNAYGAECAGLPDCGYTHAEFASSTLPDENQHSENNFGASNSDVASRHRCVANVSPRNDYPDFQQMVNLQAGDRPVYAPGLSFTITRRPPELGLCPGPIEIPRH
jgi:hypothetical protein